jgi:hypothetical protein
MQHKDVIMDETEEKSGSIQENFAISLEQLLSFGLLKKNSGA